MNIGIGRELIALIVIVVILLILIVMIIRSANKDKEAQRKRQERLKVETKSRSKQVQVELVKAEVGPSEIEENSYPELKPVYDMPVTDLSFKPGQKSKQEELSQTGILFSNNGLTGQLNSLEPNQKPTLRAPMTIDQDNLLVGAVGGAWTATTNQESGQSVILFIDDDQYFLSTNQESELGNFTTYFEYGLFTEIVQTSNSSIRVRAVNSTSALGGRGWRQQYFYFELENGKSRLAFTKRPVEVQDNLVIYEGIPSIHYYDRISNKNVTPQLQEDFTNFIGDKLVPGLREGFKASFDFKTPTKLNFNSQGHTVEYYDFIGDTEITIVE